MKKLMFLLLVAALLMASCSNDESVSSLTPQKDEVSFRALVDHTTRGEAVTLANLQKFRVFAKGADALESEFTDIVTDGGDGSSWNTQSVHYWTTVVGNENKQASFTGVYPDDLISTYSPTTALDFSSLTNGRDQKEVMTAFNVGTKAADADYGVALRFKHVLSQIVVCASNKNTEERKVEIVGVKIANVKTKNTLYLPTVPTNGTSTYNPYSAAATTPIDMIIKGKASNAVTLTAAVQNIMFDEDGTQGGFMVLPQDFTSNAPLAATDTYISVLARIYEKDGSGNWKLIYPYLTTDNGEFAFTAVGIDGTWEAGKKYTYTLNFYQGNGGAGTVDPDYTDPTDNPDPAPNPNPDDPDEPKQPSDTDTPPTDPTSPDPTDPDSGTTKVPIFFTVTVEDWQDADGDFNKIMD